MDLERKTILILGGSGLVGQAIARRLLDYGPAKIVVAALDEADAKAAAAQLRPYAGDTTLEHAWGNVFWPMAAAQRPRGEVLDDPAVRRVVLDDLLDEMTPELLHRSALYDLIHRHAPHAVIDCINTATALAYQDVFQSARGLLDQVEQGLDAERVERHVLTLTMPQLIRHVQILVEATKAVGTEAYVKIGTSGTGGMGLNIPYTHSEERPSRPLLTKAAVAGAHSLMLFLLGRTPGAPTAIEIKPTAAIAWRRITHGPIRRGGRVLPLMDCPEPLDVAAAFGDVAAGWTDLGRPLESVFIDVGENGVFAADEFETVTSLRQMEFITPEEVAEYAVTELRGRSSGRDIVTALDASTAGPTYNAGVLRGVALERLRALEAERGQRSVAFEMLGPPRLTKMLYEAFILSQLCPTVRSLAERDPGGLADDASRLVAGDAELRSVIVSVGLPILLCDGKVYRGAEVLITPRDGDTDRAAARGWVDLRVDSLGRWVDRAARMVTQAENRPAPGTGSDEDWRAVEVDAPIGPAGMATWVFRYEDDGERIKR